MDGIITTPLDQEGFGIPGIGALFPNNLSLVNATPTTSFDQAGQSILVGVQSSKPVPTILGTPATGEIFDTYFDDYYNQIWVLPKSMDFGALGGDSFRTFTVWNAFWQQSKVITSISAQDNEGVALVGPSVPTTYKPLESVAYTVNVGMDGPASIAAKFTLTFGDGFIGTVDVTGSRAKMWTSYHNWRNSFKATYEFSTEILVSWSGKEQRIAHRTTPRKTLTYSRNLHGDSFRAFNDLMWSWQHRTFIMPELTRKVTLTTDLAPGGDTLTLASVPEWMQAEATVIFMHQDVQELRVVESVADTLVTFKSSSATLWPEGSLVYYAVPGYLNGPVAAPRKTNTTAVATMTFNVVPLSEPYIAPGIPTGPMLNGREIYDKRPNWSSDVAVSTEHDVETVDYGRGPVARFFPVQFGRMLRTHAYVSRTPEEAEAALKFFHRQYGQQGEFYMPTWDADIVPVATAGTGTATLRIKGSSFFEAYGTSTVHKALAVRMKTGAVIYRTIVSITMVSDTGGTDSLITINGTWPNAVSADNTAFISWLLVWRFATDLLTIEHLTTTVAQYQLTFRSLEDLTPETV